MFPEMRMGLPAPKKDEPGFNTMDFNELRQAIERGARDSPLIGNCLRQAQYAGLSGEDKYTLLAYQALLMLEQFHQRTLRIAELSPNPGVLFTKDGPLQK